MLPCWSRSDGEENVGDQNSLTTSRTSRSLVTKVSIAWVYLDTYSHLLITHLHVSNFDTRKDILVFELSCSLFSYGLNAYG